MPRQHVLDAGIGKRVIHRQICTTRHTADVSDALALKQLDE
jgi:hypothetical protein